MDPDPNSELLEQCDNWFYVDTALEQQIGPSTASELIEAIRSSEVDPHSQVWCEHLPSWLALSTVPFLARYIPPSPSLPQSDDETPQPQPQLQSEPQSEELAGASPLSPKSEEVADASPLSPHSEEVDDESPLSPHSEEVDDAPLLSPHLEEVDGTSLLSPQAEEVDDAPPPPPHPEEVDDAPPPPPHPEEVDDAPPPPPLLLLSQSEDVDDAPPPPPPAPAAADQASLLGRSMTNYRSSKSRRSSAAGSERVRILRGSLTEQASTNLAKRATVGSVSVSASRDVYETRPNHSPSEDMAGIRVESRSASVQHREAPDAVSQQSHRNMSITTRTLASAALKLEQEMDQKQPSDGGATSQHPRRTLSRKTSRPSSSSRMGSRSVSVMASLAGSTPTVVTGNARLDQELLHMQNELELISHRRIPLCFPILDLNRFVGDLETSAFMGLSKEYIISQLFLEVSKAREEILFPSVVEKNEQYALAFGSEIEKTREMLANLKSDTANLTNALELALQEEQERTNQSFPVVRLEIEKVRLQVRSEVAFCRRRLEKHDYMLSHPSTFAFYQTLLLGLMQILVACRFASGIAGPNKDRYKARMAKEPKLSVLMKKGVEIMNCWYPMPRLHKGKICLDLLDTNIASTHSKHFILRTFIDECSPPARFAAAVQEVCDCVAQTLVFRFEEQIRQLVPDSAHILSEYAARAMATLIKRDNAGEHHSLPAFFVASVQDEAVVSMKSGRSMKMKKEKLITVRGVHVDTWNAVGIFRKTGVRLIDNRGREHFFEGGLFKGSPLKYGYRSGSERECRALGMVETQQRRRPDMSITSDVCASRIGQSDGPSSYSQINSFEADQQTANNKDTSISSFNNKASEKPEKGLLTRNSSVQSIAPQSSLAATENSALKSRVSALEKSMKDLMDQNRFLYQQFLELRHIITRNGLY